MLPVPTQVIEILNSGHVLCIKDDKNTTYWRFQDNKLQNKVKHKSGETDWMDIKFLILPLYEDDGYGILFTYTCYLDKLHFYLYFLILIKGYLDIISDSFY